MALVDRACASRCRNLGFLFLQAAAAISDYATAFGVG
jgi:hypothetical protein